MQWAPWGGTRGRWEQKASPGSTYETEVQENWGCGGMWQSNGKSQKESLRNDQKAADVPEEDVQNEQEKENNRKMSEM